jgi:hypothetical protein
MRTGDFSVEIIPADGGTVRYLPNGQVLARPGQVYLLRLRNHGPLRAVADVHMDGRLVTAGGLVLHPASFVDLERPIHATERGRFTVFPEGSEKVFGPDGGRDNPDLGLIHARFRRELPRPAVPVWSSPTIPSMPRIDPAPAPLPLGTPPVPGSPVPPEWIPPRHVRPFFARASFDVEAVERAAGTGLTGSSSQEFVATHVGELEKDATIIQLRLVIGSEAALREGRPLPVDDAVPARPEPRP